MNSRERVLASLNHKEPDRIPVDFGGHRSSGISVQAYKKLREYLGLKPSKLYIYDFIQQLVFVEDDVLDITGSDVVTLGRSYLKNEDYWQDWMLQDGTPCKIPGFIKVQREKDGYVVYGDGEQAICIQKNGSLYFEQTCFPLEYSDEDEFTHLSQSFDKIMWCKLGAPPAPAGFDDNGLKIWQAAAGELRQSTDRAIYGLFGANLYEMGQFVFRMDNFLYELAANPARMHRFLDKLTEIHIENLTRYLGAVGEYIDIIGFGDDLGMQTGPQISPDMYREFFKPRHKMIWTHAKKLFPHLKVCLHSCGGIYPLLKDLIEAGIDAVNPVQISCRDMEPARLKKEYGERLTFWGGGCDTRDVLPNGSPEQIRQHVRTNIGIMAPGGGFVFQQVHNILANVPPENIMAMFDAVRETGR
jgi:uroporphyrinogen decarboxylase